MKMSEDFPENCGDEKAVQNKGLLYIRLWINSGC
jgi:hypothetical protein